MPPGRTQNTSTTPGAGHPAATPLGGSAEPPGAIGIGLFQFPPFSAGCRPFVNTMPSERTQVTSTSPAPGQTAATPLRGSAEPTGAIGIGLIQFPPFSAGCRPLVNTMSSYERR